MKHDYSPGDCESEAESGTGTFARAAHEWIENLFYLFFRNSRPVVGTENLYPAHLCRWLCSKLDFAVFRCVAKRISEAVVERAR